MSVFCPYNETSKSYDSTREPLGLNIILGSMCMSKEPLNCQKFLDIGCGTGTFLEAIKDKFDSVVGLEHSEGMLSQARLRLGDEVSLVKGSADALPFEEHAFDAITINQVIHHFPPDNNFAFANRVFKEIFRVLKPGGVFVLNTSTPEQQRDSFWWMSLFPKASEAMCKSFPPLGTLELQLKKAGFVLNADSMSVPTRRTLMAENKYLEHGMHGGFDPAYRAGDSSWSMAEKTMELEHGLKKLREMIDDGSAEQWLQERESLRLQQGQATFISVQKSSQSTVGPAVATNIQASLWPDKNSTNPVNVASDYNAAAATYEAASMKDGWQVTFDHLFPELDLALSSGAQMILDAGCSTGLLPKVYKMPAHVELHGVDISPGCLALAKIGGHYASLQEANLEDVLPFPSKKFDLVVCNGVLGYCATNKALFELLRVLKPGGHLLMAFRHEHYLARGYDKLLEDTNTCCTLVDFKLYDPFPNNPAYKHTYILAIVQKTSE
jgi:ubiquinone/menaquinone biosynthesis C-methylase UbiE